MKKITLVFLFLCFSVSMLAQDIILTKENERIEAKVLMEYEAVIQYRLFDAPTDSTCFIKKEKINTITYANGKVVSFEDFNSTPPKTTISAQAVPPNDPVAKLPAKKQNEFKCLVRFKPIATIAGAILGIFNYEMVAVPYVHPKIGIPVEVQFAFANRTSGIAVLTGIEAVPVTHQEKSGLYLNYEIGGIFIAGYLGLGTAAHVGYQLVTKKGFVLTPALGFQYDTLSQKISFHYMLDIGFALKRK